MNAPLGSTETMKGSVQAERPSLLKRLKANIPPMPWTKREAAIIEGAGQRDPRDTLLALSGQGREVQVERREPLLRDEQGKIIGHEVSTTFLGCNLEQALQATVTDQEQVNTWVATYEQSMHDTDTDYRESVLTNAHQITHPRNLWRSRPNAVLKIPTGAKISDMHMVGMHVLEGPKGTRVATDIADKVYTSDDQGFRMDVIQGPNITHEDGEVGRDGQHTILSTLTGPDGRSIQIMIFEDVRHAASMNGLNSATKLMVRALAQQGILSVNPSGRPILPFTKEEQG